MDFDRASRIINMDVTGVNPGPPSHVRILGNEDLAEFVRAIDNEPDMVTFEVMVGFDEFDDGELRTIEEPPDVVDESTDTARTFVVEVHFDAPTDLEASLATSAIAGFVRRRLNLDNVVVIGRDNQTVG